MLPRLAMTQVRHARYGDPVAACGLIVRDAAGTKSADVSDIVFVDLGKVMLGSNAERSIAQVIADVLKTSTPVQIVKAVVGSVAVTVATLGSIRGAADKRLQDRTMNVFLYLPIILADDYLRVVLTRPKRQRMPCAPFVASGMANIRDLIARAVGDVFPDFFHKNGLSQGPGK